MVVVVVVVVVVMMVVLVVVVVVVVVVVGGVNKTQADGLKIRGDINLILMGDPGVGE